MKFALLAATLVVVTACSEDGAHEGATLDASMHPEPDAGHAVTKRDAAPPPPPAHTAVVTPHDAAVISRQPDAPVISAPGCSGDLPVLTVRDSLTFMEVEPDFGCYQHAGTDGGTDRDAGPDSGAVVRKVSFDTVLKALGAGATVDFASR